MRRNLKEESWILDISPPEERWARLIIQRSSPLHLKIPINLPPPDHATSFPRYQLGMEGDLSFGLAYPPESAVDAFRTDHLVVLATSLGF